ncbi:MAG TPA: hypothetical protein VJL08_00115 [Dehalococcoidia bacterium]|nr:hypothetical protein [Dehalococcoidia bacterium]
MTLVYLATFLLLLLRRASARLRRDIGGNSNKTQIIFTRLLYDRSRL